MNPTGELDDQTGQQPAIELSAAEQAKRCRRLARSAFDRSTVEMLDRMADDFERQAQSKRR